MWDPGQYRRFTAERARPFYELVARIGAQAPRSVADLGCGPGDLTVELARRWPGAAVLGVDSSPEMLAQARRWEGHRGVSFEQADITDWCPAAPVDVLTASAVLQWVPGHLGLLPRCVSWLSPGGWLAFQLPGNLDSPPHATIRELAGSPRWASRLGGAEFARQAGDPAGYLDVLAGAGCRVDAWETTYQHVLGGADPVVEWLKGTALRPVLTALDDVAAAEFVAEFRERMRQEYPARPFGTVLPFRRVFVVAQRPA